MKKPSDAGGDWEDELARIVGLDAHSTRKSHYPELRRRLAELEVANQSLIEEVQRREQAEAALRVSERQFRQIVETSLEGIIGLDEHACVTFINRRMAELLGYPPDGFVGRAVRDFMAPEEWADHELRMRNRRAGLAECYERRYCCRDGRSVVMLTNATPLLDETGRFCGSFAMLTDITAQRQAEEERQTHIHFLESLNQINRAIQQATDPEQLIWDVVQITFRTFECDRAWLLYPCDPQAATYRIPVEITRPEYPGGRALNIDLPMKPGADEACRLLLAAEGPLTFGPAGDFPLLAGMSEPFGIRSFIAVSLHPKAGKPWVLGLHQCSHARVWSTSDRRLFNEISRRIADGLSSLLFLRDLHASELRFRSIFEQCPIGIAVYDATGRVLNANRTCLEIFGIPDLSAITDWNFFDDPNLPADAAPRLQAGETVRFELRYDSAQAQDRGMGTALRETRDLDVIFTPLRPAADQPIQGYILLAQDFTHRKHLEAQLLQAQKMEAVGQLAGGVAHDFNNILTAILGNTELTLNQLQTPQPALPPALDGLRQIERSALRAAALTRQLLAFSRRQVVQPRVVDVRETLLEMQKMLGRVLTENITLELHCVSPTWPVRIDPGQLEQVITNLVVNARDAMPGGGTLTLQTRNATLDDEYVSAHPDAHPGPHALLIVSDTGSGMAATVLRRIFEPFFTTKPFGQGTGLGLAMVYGIVRQAGGHITVYSEPGQGSAFRVYLPAVVDASAERAPAPTPGALPVGTETILLCEDDEAVRELAALVLRNAGYTVLSADRGAKAVELAGNHDAPLDLLVTDVIMPDTNGKQLADLLCATRSNLRVLFISGYTADVIAHHGVLDVGVEFLEKPFTRQALLQRVRGVLDSAE